MPAHNSKLTEGPIVPTLIKLTLPMILGIVSMVAFNLIDTMFVGRLGDDELAAISFTFPVVMVVGGIAMGLGIGISAVVSKAIGEKNQEKVIRFTTDGLLLALLIVAIFAIIGILTIDPLFTLLGVNDKIMPLVESYMSIWYLGVIFIIVPMAGNNAIRATGDTVTPSIIMITAAGISP